MFIFYDLISIIFILCYLPFFLLRKKYHRGLLMRFGIFARSAIDKVRDKKIIWIHAVSVGETQSIATLIRNLKQEYPDFCIVVSTVTKTGNEIARKIIGSQDLAIYIPLDISIIVKKVIGIINPSLFIVVETELWPNLIINLNRKDIPVVLINGRISESSFRGYKVVGLFFKKVLRSFSLLCMQTEEDARRIIELGADRQKVHVTGNMKFDVQDSGFRVQDSELGLRQDEQLFIAGSTHPGEEEIILRVYKELIKKHPYLRLLIAPRHIERAREIERLISKFGFTSQRISQLNLDSQLMRPVLILDTIGQLKNLYKLAEIVFIGGSLVRHGGQNPLEPAIFFKPILFGPYMYNFSEIVQVFLSRKAAIMVKNEKQLKDSCLRFLEKPSLREELGKRAKGLLLENRGASLRNIELIKGLLPASKGGS